MNRTKFLKTAFLMIILGAYPLRADEPVKPETTGANILFIAVDDLNDWIGCMGGHPQAKTPNIDRLAKMGTLFSNAHCQSPVCNPSRASLMSSLYPETTGIYFLSPPFHSTPHANTHKVMSTRFKDEGYEVAAAGKIFHSSGNKKYFPTYAGSFGGVGPFPKKKLSPYKGVRLWDWGAFPEKDDQMPDHEIAGWGVEQLGRKHTKPFFLATGFHRPHVPQYAPQKWFDMYPTETLQLPKVIAGDLADLSKYTVDVINIHQTVAPKHDWVLKNKEWKPLVRSYLACVSFVDHQVGRLLDALENSPHRDNTYIVLFTDHGFHLGEKERWAKRSLWEDGTRTPLIIAGPGVGKGKVCKKPVQLLDIYPTLLELTGNQADKKLEGNSMVPLLQDSNAEWPHMARTSFGPGNVAIRSEHFRYVKYLDGSEEFYDHREDTHEWKNQISNPKYAAEIEKHRRFLPTKAHKILGIRSIGHKAYYAAGTAHSLLETEGK